MNSILLHGCLILIEIFFIDDENFGYTRLNLIYIEKTLWSVAAIIHSEPSYDLNEIISNQRTFQEVQI